jgi:hypothetical protein
MKSGFSGCLCLLSCEVSFAERTKCVVTLRYLFATLARALTFSAGSLQIRRG